MGSQTQNRENIKKKENKKHNKKKRRIEKKEWEGFKRKPAWEGFKRKPEWERFAAQGKDLTRAKLCGEIANAIPWTAAGIAIS